MWPAVKSARGCNEGLVNAFWRAIIARLDSSVEHPLSGGSDGRGSNIRLVACRIQPAGRDGRHA
jgi:hypothetical protein